MGPDLSGSNPTFVPGSGRGRGELGFGGRKRCFSMEEIIFGKKIRKERDRKNSVGVLNFTDRWN